MFNFKDIMQKKESKKIFSYSNINGNINSTMYSHNNEEKIKDGKPINRFEKKNINYNNKNNKNNYNGSYEKKNWDDIVPAVGKVTNDNINKIMNDKMLLNNNFIDSKIDNLENTNELYNMGYIYHNKITNQNKINNNLSTKENKYNDFFLKRGGNNNF